MSALDAPPKLDMSPIRQDTTPDEAAYAVFYLGGQSGTCSIVDCRALFRRRDAGAR